MMAAVSMMLFLSSTTMAAPLESEPEIIVNLVRRKPTLKDSDNINLDDKVPLDAIVLVGAAMGMALICFLISLYKMKTPNTSGTRRVREERAQAYTELRLKGGGVSPGGSGSPTRNMIEKKRHQSNGTTGTEYLSTDSHSKLVSNMPPPGRYGPKVATDYPRNSRASRGYVYKQKMGPMNTSSMLAVPTLSSNAVAPDYASPPGSSAASSTSHSQWQQHRPAPLQDRSHSYGFQNQRVSSQTIGRGVDLNNNRSRNSKNTSIHLNPQSVESSHQGGMSSDMHDPLTGYELKRLRAEQQADGMDNSGKNGSMNALDFFGYSSGGSPIYANRTYSNSGSDNLSHEAGYGPSTPSAIPRTKQMHFYNDEQDGQQSPGLESALMHAQSYGRYASPTKPDRRVWANHF
jgi:hypothetical protein